MFTCKLVVFPGDFQAWMLAMQQFWTYLVDTWAGHSTFSFYRTCTIECTWSTVDCATMYGNDVLADLPFEWVSKVKECTHSVGRSPSEEMMKLQFPVLNLAYCISKYNDVHCTIKNIHPLPHGEVTKFTRLRNKNSALPELFPVRSSSSGPNRNTLAGLSSMVCRRQKFNLIPHSQCQLWVHTCGCTCTHADDREFTYLTVNVVFFNKETAL